MSKAHPRDPRRLDVAAAAAEDAVLAGEWPLATLERLADGPAGDGRVAWSAHFEQRTSPGAARQCWLHLRAGTRVWRDCQRCLQPVAIELAVDRWLRFVADEATAAALDPDSEEDLLVLSRAFDLHALVEDELLLELPLVPKHERCPDPLPAAHDPAEAAAKDNPFAALAALKRRADS
jgi:uncharacterized protein